MCARVRVCVYVCVRVTNMSRNNPGTRMLPAADVDDAVEHITCAEMKQKLETCVKTVLAARLCFTKSREISRKQRESRELAKNSTALAFQLTETANLLKRLTVQQAKVSRATSLQQRRRVGVLVFCL